MDAAPPPYRPSATQPSFAPTLLTLPDHLVLHILSHLSLPTLSLQLRPICRKLHLFSTHLLRRALYSRWRSCIRHGWTTSPLGSSSPLSPLSTILPLRRETAILDLFISSLVLVLQREEESGLHLLVEEMREATWGWDMFELLQPRARIEDLVIEYGSADGLVRTRRTGRDAKEEGEIWEEDVEVQLTKREVKVLLPFGSESARGRTLMKVVGGVEREEGEGLEMLAAKLVDELARVKVSRVSKGCYIRL